MPDVATTVRRSTGRKVKVYGQFVRFTNDAVLFRVERIEGFDVKEPKEVWIPKSLTYMETGKPYIEVDYWKVRQLLGESLEETTYYHAAPTAIRNSILTHGITPQRSEVGRWSAGKGFYAFTDFDEAVWYAQYMGQMDPVEPFDIWSFESDVVTEPDIELTADPEEKTSSVYHPEPVPVDKLSLVLAGESDSDDEEEIESLEEDEQVDLDPDFFDDENRLREDVRSVMLKVVNNVFEKLDEKGFDVQPAGIWLTGSLCGPNWDEHSDVDLHVGIDFSRYAQPELMKQALSYFARNFNNNEYDLLDRSLELYFQDTIEAHSSPGVYDIENDHWHQPPDGVRIEVTEEMKRAAAKYLEQVETLKAEYVEIPRSEAESFMARLKTFWEGIKTMRKEGLESEGRASFGNQVFKQLRRNNTLPTFVELISQVQDDIYEVER